MMRTKPAASMQKTYDDCYLICSTAIYFEGQNNEAEALRSWRNALDQIYYHNAYRMPANYRPKTETEKALEDSLRDMEMQCKERVELLEAIRRSRADPREGEDRHGSPTARGRAPAARTPGQEPSGWLGDGTVPALEQSALWRPPLPHRAAPHSRPPLPAKASSSTDTFRRARSLPQADTVDAPASTSPPPLVAPPKKGSRTPSPEKKGGMLKTLRTSGKGSSSARANSSMLRPPPAPASKAATQAWGALFRGAGSNLSNSYSNMNGSTTTISTPAPEGANGHPVSRAASLEMRRRDISGASTNGPIRPPSPSDFLHNRKQSLPERVARPQNSHAQYPEVRTSSPTYSRPTGPISNPEDYNPLGPPTPVHYNLPKNNSVSGSGSRNGPSLNPIKPSRLESDFFAYRKEYPEPTPIDPRKVASKVLPRSNGTDYGAAGTATHQPTDRKPPPLPMPRKAVPKPSVSQAEAHKQRGKNADPYGSEDETISSGHDIDPKRKHRTDKARSEPQVLTESPTTSTSSYSETPGSPCQSKAWQERVDRVLKNLSKGVDDTAAKQIMNEIVIKGDEVHWSDIAGLDIAKAALKEAVVYPFLRPDLFMGLREPARGMLLFGPPGTGKTMLARAVATESKSTFFAISASSLTSKYLGESEKLVRALFSLAKALAPSIIFVDEIDSLLSSRGGSSEHEATRRIKTEFLIQWSDLQKAAAGREQGDKEKKEGDASRVLVLAATNMPWAIDEAARRRFVRRQYIPLPEDHVRETQLRTLLSAQKHSLTDRDLKRLVRLTDGFSGSDITALAKDAAMGPLRSLGEKLLHMTMEEIRPISFEDFETSLVNIRPSVSKAGLKEFEDWAREFGERGG